MDIIEVMKLLKKLREMGMNDVGFGMTVQDKNAPDLVPFI